MRKDSRQTAHFVAPKGSPYPARLGPRAAPRHWSHQWPSTSVCLSLRNSNRRQRLGLFGLKLTPAEGQPQQSTAGAVA